MQRGGIKKTVLTVAVVASSKAKGEILMVNKWQKRQKASAMEMPQEMDTKWYVTRTVLPIPFLLKMCYGELGS